MTQMHGLGSLDTAQMLERGREAEFSAIDAVGMWDAMLPAVAIGIENADGSEWAPEPSTLPTHWGGTLNGLAGNAKDAKAGPNGMRKF